MSKVIVGMSVSLDGIAGGADADADGWAIHEAVLGWLFPLRSWRAAAGQEGGEDSVDSRIWADDFDRIGAQVIGRRMFDFGYPHWGEDPPFHAPVFVLTSRGQERIDKSGGTSYTFVTDGIKAAVDQARAAAGGKDVLLAGGVSIAQQALAASLVDEVRLHVAPVLVGRGLSLFGTSQSGASQSGASQSQIGLRCVDAVQGENALHLRYTVS